MHDGDERTLLPVRLQTGPFVPHEGVATQNPKAQKHRMIMGKPLTLFCHPDEGAKDQEGHETDPAENHDGRAGAGKSAEDEVEGSAVTGDTEEPGESEESEDAEH